MRGENVPVEVVDAEQRGTSPRARGKRAEVSMVGMGIRNIPACAGKTLESAIRLDAIEEHPRVRGENA